MNLSTILVVTPVDRVESTKIALNAQHGVEVHVSEENSGRMIATLEAGSIDDEVDGLRRIKSIPDILYAEMVMHYFEQGVNPDEA